MVALLKGFFFKETVSIYTANNNNIKMGFLQMQGVVIDKKGNIKKYILYLLPVHGYILRNCIFLGKY